MPSNANKLGKPYLNGKRCNAMFNGNKIWKDEKQHNFAGGALAIYLRAGNKETNPVSFLDHSGNNNTGTLGGTFSSALWTNQDFIKFTKASNQNIITGVNLNSLSNLTFEIYVKINQSALTGTPGVIGVDGTGSGGAGCGFIVRHSTSRIEAWFAGQSNHLQIAYSAINFNDFNHFVLTYDNVSREQKIYLNGELRGTKTGTGSLTVANRMVHMMSFLSSVSSYAIDGDFKYGGIWNRVLTQQEISNNYEEVKKL